MEIRFPSGATGTFVCRKIPDGSYVHKDTALIEYKDANGAVQKVKTASDGIVRYKSTIKKGAEIEEGSLIAQLGPCAHEIVIKELCAACGKDLRQKDETTGERKETTKAKVSMIHHVPELTVSHKLAKELGSKDEKGLLEARKLVLLVDLDQTIIHTTNRPFKINPEKNKDVIRYKIYGGEYTTKLRPYTKEFLQAMNKLYQMHIVTYGQRQYAHKIAQIIDPDRSLFGERVLSRDELFSAHHKTANLSALFPNGDQLVTIIDDRADVWQYSEALIQMKPYRFFREVGDINAPKGSNDSGVLPVDTEENPEEDGILENIERVLTEVHKSFFQQYDATKKVKDVKEVLSEQKKEVLRGLVFVLSGVVPLGIQPERSDAYRLCRQFGARVDADISDETTHVIAVRWGTNKVHQALKKKIPVVTPQWLYTCVEKWTKAKESAFELTKDTVVPTGLPLGGAIVSELVSIDAMSKETISNMEHEVDDALSDSDDDDDDDVAEEKLEDEEEEEVDGEPAKGLAKRRADGELGTSTSADNKKCRRQTVEEENTNVSSGDESDPDDEEMADYDREDEEDAEDTTRDGFEDDDDDEEIDDMAALIERQISGEDQ